MTMFHRVILAFALLATTLPDVHVQGSATRRNVPVLTHSQPFASKEPPQIRSAKAKHAASLFDKMGFEEVRQMAERQAAEPGHEHMFNAFRLLGDFLHLSSFIFLLIQFHTAKSCTGISLKSQELYLAVFLLRYVDIFWNFISMYNTVMKLLFISTTLYIIYMMRFPLKNSATKEPNGARIAALICSGALLLALLYNDHFPESSMWNSFMEIAWTFSIYLEAVAIVPQMIMLGRAKIVKNLTANYLFSLGAYRVFYLLNYAYRFSVDPGSSREFIIKAISAVVQSALYIRFFMMYLESKKNTGVGADVILNQKGIV